MFDDLIIMKLKVLIVDDHPAIRKGLAAILEEENVSDEIYMAETGGDAMAIILENKPQLVMMDISLPDITGLEVITNVKKMPELADEDIRFLVLSVHVSPEYIYRSFKSGADGMLSKSSMPDELLTGISALMRGEKYLGPNVSTKPLDEIMMHFDRINFSDYDPETVYLTFIETKVLALLMQGHKAKEIAEHLFISVRTVEGHKAMIMKKMKVTSFIELQAIITKSEKLKKDLDEAFD